jgi:quinol monooxygenase YgiN
VKPEYIDSFVEVSLDNACNSVQELGVVHFDLLQEQDDPTRFILYEIYRAPEDQLAHRETAHYARWRDAVADMMVEGRTVTKYDVLFPPE